MQYFGGKQRISKPLADFINGELSDGQAFVDLFCGSCNVVSKIRGARKRFANDKHESLIALFKGLQDGFQPPDKVTEQDYQDAKLLPNKDPLKGFVGFGCSFSGKWFGGYARGGYKRNYALNAKNSLSKKMKSLSDVDFLCGDYRDVVIPDGSLVYCGIPYLDATGYSVGEFSHEEFYEWCKSQKGCRVIVSEYKQNVPVGATVIWQHKSKKDIRNSEGEQEGTIEVLFEFK